MGRGHLGLRLILCGAVLLAAAARMCADSAVLIPMDKEAPDPSILSLTEMEVDIHIDNGDARVWIRQIYTNHTGKLEEGNYVFALPSGTQISDFAVWDGPVRIYKTKSGGQPKSYKPYDGGESVHRDIP